MFTNIVKEKKKKLNLSWVQQVYLFAVSFLLEKHSDIMKIFQLLSDSLQAPSPRGARLDAQKSICSGLKDGGLWFCPMWRDNKCLPENRPFFLSCAILSVLARPHGRWVWADGNFQAGRRRNFQGSKTQTPLVVSTCRPN